MRSTLFMLFSGILIVLGTSFVMVQTGHIPIEDYLDKLITLGWMLVLPSFIGILLYRSQRS